MNKTDAIFQLSCPYDNPYQQQDRYARWLFVCSAGLLRSPTGANLYAKKGYNTRAAGVHPYALVPLSVNLIAWADRIIFVDGIVHEYALTYFKHAEPELFEKLKLATVLDIADVHDYNEPGLRDKFEQALGV